MKLIICLLVAICCASQVQCGVRPLINWQAEPRFLFANPEIFEFSSERNLLEEIRNVLKKLAEQAVEFLKEIREKTDKLLADLLKELEDLVAQAQQTLKQYLDDIKNQFEDLIQNQIGPCVENVPSKFDQIAQQTQAEIQKCNDDANVRLEGVANNFQEHGETYQKIAGEINEIVQECLNKTSIVDEIRCGLDSIPDVLGKVKELLNDGKLLLEETTKELVSIATDTRGCVNDSLIQARLDMETVLKDVETCLAN
uniref:Putative conserved secreted protein n=1 Tax=Corethrella appendiculata TaxID=1370023 RepID=U5EPE0_9DIPT